MSATLEPAYSFFYAPKTLKVVHTYDAEAAIAAVNKYGRYPLNLAQKAAIKQSFAERVSLLWGPPGTGKTWTLAGLIATWVEAALLAKTPITILVGAANYNAIDNVLLQVKDLLAERTSEAPAVRIMRVRSESSEPLDVPPIEDVLQREAKEIRGRWVKPSQCTVVGGTYLQLLKVSQDYMSQKAIGAPFFDVVVLDEASQVSTASAMAYAALAKQNAHLVVCGDHRQLGPVQHVKLEDTRSGLLESAFSYLREHHGILPVSLSENYRSNEAITGWPSQRFYEDGFVSIRSKRRLEMPVSAPGAPAGWPSGAPWADEFDHILSPDEPVSVIVYDDRSSTVSNQFEAWISASLIRAYFLRLKAQDPDLDLKHFWKENAGLVTPHRAQIATVRNLIGSAVMPEHGGLSFVDTVDRFQGQERDLIIASYTVSDPDFIANEEAFILDPRRFNVTLTRARCKFILLVSRTLLTYLPADLKVANDAAHLQLFTENYCGVPRVVQLPFRNAAGTVETRTCDQYVKAFQIDA